MVFKHEHAFKLLYLAGLLKLRLLYPTSRICDSVVWEGPGIYLFKTFPKDANVWDAHVETSTLACAAHS